MGPRDLIIWGVFALVLLVAPQIFTSGLAVTMLSQIGIAIVACLSFNMLLGQGGMLSFGHAVYSGLVRTWRSMRSRPQVVAASRCR